MKHITPFLLLILFPTLLLAQPTPDCSQKIRIEHDQVIQQFGTYHIQGYTNVFVRVCETKDGLLAYTVGLDEGGSLIDLKSSWFGPIFGAGREASHIKASQKWGLYWNEDDLWIYVDGGDSFRWSRGTSGNYHCEKGPFRGYGKEQINHIIETMKDGKTEGWTEKKAQFRPYKHEYPPIIQEWDYPSVQAIETLYALLEPLGEEKANWSPTLDGLIFKGSKGGPVTLGVQNGKVVIGKDIFGDQKTIVLFTTLMKTLGTFAKPEDCREVRFTQYGTRVYSKRTVMEFGCGGEVLDLESLANGPNNDERLYVLDILKAKDSMEWMPTPPKN